MSIVRVEGKLKKCTIFGHQWLFKYKINVKNNKYTSKVFYIFFLQIAVHQYHIKMSQDPLWIPRI